MILTFALITTNLSANMFHTNLVWKQQLFVFAFALAAAASRVGGFPQ
jgi:hypothetical protein